MADNNKKKEKPDNNDQEFVSKKWILMSEEELNKWYKGKEKELQQAALIIREYHKIARMPNCNDCGCAPYCEFRPSVGQYVRFNCPLWEPNENEGDGFYYL